jgi:hypothetical protein
MIVTRVGTKKRKYRFEFTILNKCMILNVEFFKHNIHVKYGSVDLLIFDIIYNVCYNFNLGI